MGLAYSLTLDSAKQAIKSIAVEVTNANTTVTAEFSWRDEWTAV